MKKQVFLVASLLIFGMSAAAFAQNTYKIAWSHYTGWEPWAYIQESGIADKWAKKYGIEKIDIVLINDYIESINMYTAGQFDGCAMTNMDALTIPGVGGVDSTVLIIGDFSNGNDGIVLKNGTSVKDMKGRKVRLVELSVSHYLLTRALEMNRMTERDLTVVNTSDADIAGLFITESEKDPKAAVCTWNPPLMQVRNVKDADLVFDSSQIPGEIIDCLVVQSNAPDNLKKALTGAWFEAMQVMSSHTKEGKEAVNAMAKAAGGTLPEFKAQLKTTHMYYSAQDAVAFAKGDKLKETMEYVRTFSFDHGLYGNGAPDKDLVGMAFPDGSVLGDSSNIKLRFDASFMQMAAENKLQEMLMDSRKETANDKKVAIARIPQFFGLHAKPSVPLSWFLVLIPFILLIGIYMLSSDIRHRKNPSDKILPAITQMATAMKRAAFEQNKRTGEYQLWTDTAASLKRIGIGLSASALCGLFLGLHLGLLPGIRKLLLPFTTFVSIIPPLAVLPILFIVFGVDELAKVVLIFIGTFPMISRDIYLAVSRIPEEQIIKSLTLGASQPAVAFRVIVPQIMPKLIDTIRINMGPAWLFLIASEAIAATSGLGYRIFLVRRYLAMDTIIPYVLWIVLIGLVIDWGLKSIIRYRYGWYLVARE